MSVYTATFEATSISTAITILQLTSASTKILKVTGAWVSQSGSTTSATQRVQILRKTAGATVTSLTPRPVEVGAAAASATAGYNASAEGTDGVVLVPDAFNWLAGWRWTAASDREALVVPPSGIIAIKFPAAPGSAQTVTAGMVFEEIG